MTLRRLKPIIPKRQVNGDGLLQRATAIANISSLCCLLAVLFAAGAAAAGATDPYASNNGLYPPDYYNPPPSEGPYKFRKLSHAYPETAPAHTWLDVRPKGPITVENA